MDSRGQISAEYIFLILVFLIILTTVTVPFAGNAISSSQNVSITSDANIALSTIVNAVNVVYSNGPGAKRTVNLYFPQNSNLVYNNKVLSLNLVDIPVNANNTGVLKPNVNSTVPYALNILPSGGSVTKGWHNVIITWAVGSSAITVTIS